MLPTDFVARANKFLRELETAEPLFAALRLLDEQERGLAAHWVAVATGGNALNQAAGNAHNHFASARRVLPQISSRKLFNAIDRVVSASQSFGAGSADGGQFIAPLLADIDQFSSLFESFLSEQSGVNAVPLLPCASSLLNQLETVRRALSFAAKQLEGAIVLADDEEAITLYFPGEQSLAELGERIVALHEVFAIVARLLGVESAARVLRLQYGSLLAELAVAKSVLNVARPWISGLVSFLYRTRTVEGSLSSGTAASKDAIKQAVDIRQLLKKAGLDTSKMDAEIEQAGAAMAKNVALLVGNQLRFRVDEQDFTVQAPTLIESRRVERLPPPTNE